MIGARSDRDNMDTKQKTEPRILLRMQTAHLGEILFKLQFVALATALASVFSFVALVVYLIFLVFISIGTLGMIYAAYPQLASWWSGVSAIAEVFSVFNRSWKFTAPIAMVLSVLSALCLFFGKKDRDYARIAVCAVVLVAAIVMMIIASGASV